MQVRGKLFPNGTYVNDGVHNGRPVYRWVFPKGAKGVNSHLIGYREVVIQCAYSLEDTGKLNYVIGCNRMIVPRYVHT